MTQTTIFVLTQISKDDMHRVIFDALDNGYRHFDTAHAYRTERSLGHALEDAIIFNKVKRSELHITTKVRYISIYTSNGFCVLPHF